MMNLLPSPIISFILPIYNVEKYLEKAIQSILSQPIEKEIILVNDGSTDNSLNIALNFAMQYSFITVISSQNRGVSFARNQGLAIARGEYVLFLDPDDILDPQADLNTAYLFAKQQKAQVIKGQYSGYYLDRPQHKTLLSPTLSSVTEHSAGVSDLLNFFQQALSRRWFLQLGCFLFERQFLLENQIIFNEKLDFTEDGLFLINIYSEQGKIVELPIPFFCYQLRLDSVSNKPVPEKHIIDCFSTINDLQQKELTCTNLALKTCYVRTRAIYSLFTHHQIESLPTLALREKYLKWITPEFVAFYIENGAVKC